MSLAALVSCGRTAKVSGVIEGASGRDVIVNLLNVNKMQAVDTVKTASDGSFSVKVDVKKGQPEFIYLYVGDKRVAPVLVAAGDKIEVSADTLGHFDVKGSEESELYAEVEKSYADFIGRMDKLYEQDDVKALSAEYVAYYRDRLKFVLAHSHSMAVVPVLFQTFGAGVPVFSQHTDAIHFNNVSDSLESVYPDSKYLKALRNEASSRTRMLDLNIKMSSATSVGYPDIELLDINAEKKKLSEVEGKLVLLYFWSPQVDAQKVFNLDVMLPIYQKYHSRGLEIYQVALEVDKAFWATVVKNQKLPWTNVCDVKGASSSSVILYNIQSTPSIFLIKDGSLVDETFETGAELDSAIGRLLN